MVQPFRGASTCSKRKSPLIILTFAAPDLIEKHANDYLKLVGSIKKIE